MQLECLCYIKDEGAGQRTKQHGTDKYKYVLITLEGKTDKRMSLFFFAF